VIRAEGSGKPAATSATDQLRGLDLCIRVLRGGRKLVFEPRAVMRHMRRDRFSSLLRTSWRWDFFTHHFNGGYNFFLKLLFNFRWARVLA
jgi:hypothetical protein